MIYGSAKRRIAKTSRRRTMGSSPAALVLLGVLAPWMTAEASEPPQARFPGTVTTIDGAELDLAAMATKTTVVVVTLKAPWCLVCQRQLVRIKARRTELGECGLSFVVLAPGPRDELAAIRDRTGVDYPFVEDRGLAISESLGLRMSEDQIVPAIIMLKDDLSVGWTQQGRSSAYYGDQALVEKVACWKMLPI